MHRLNLAAKNTERIHEKLNYPKRFTDNILEIRVSISQNLAKLGVGAEPVRGGRTGEN